VNHSPRRAATNTFSNPCPRKNRKRNSVRAHLQRAAEARTRFWI
jgi:hypothetical protein